MILSLVETHDIMLRIMCRTLLDIDKAIRRVFSIRKCMKFECICFYAVSIYKNYFKYIFYIYSRTCQLLNTLYNVYKKG